MVWEAGVGRRFHWDRTRRTGILDEATTEGCGSCIVGIRGRSAVGHHSCLEHSFIGKTLWHQSPSEKSSYNPRQAMGYLQGDFQAGLTSVAVSTNGYPLRHRPHAKVPTLKERQGGASTFYVPRMFPAVWSPPLLNVWSEMGGWRMTDMLVVCQAIHGSHNTYVRSSDDRIHVLAYLPGPGWQREES